MSTQTHHVENPDGPNWPTWTFADRLRKVRMMTGLDQRTFAGHLEAGASAYAQWEAGNNQPRDVVAIARRIELLTRVPAAWVLGLETEDPRPGDPDGGQTGAPSGTRTPNPLINDRGEAEVLPFVRRPAPSSPATPARRVA